ncbi:NADH dehydrogenase subunit H [Anaerolinea thermolimosa]|uniref:NADH-quinone oxidoreductase subunit NuoH n=1 Tax=Anaerolinea thermolimosa TaxID=229919 RepID=UPI0007834267|nr:NADH-quinone oxidoreductase subunit NuoH [Anaerolinea thermolimosa]GAP05813.1 NADH dehydrogenase subunit H [Anaerolinea thermolimosa]
MTPWYQDPVQFIAEWLRGVLLGWGMPPSGVELVLTVLGAGTIALLAMLWVVFLIWYERKLIGRIQDRFGPNRVGPWGIFQPIADMLKIFTKEYITPEGVDRVPYNLAPILAVASVLLIWAVIPFTMTVMGVNLNVGIVYIIASGGLGVLGIILAGWSSNNKYALLGGFRAVAQLVSYEVPMVVSLLIPVILAGSLGVNDIVMAQRIPYLLSAPVAALIFFITSMAETGRSPFDLTEAESEIVAGFNIEYSGLKFGMFYVAEFLHAFTVSLLFATLFLGGWRGPLAEQVPLLGFVYLVVKTFVVYFVVILFRGSLPRFRIDQMMDLNWKLLTPLALVSLVVSALVAKPLEEMPLAQTLALLVSNGIVLILFIEGTGKKVQRKREIVGKPRPLAVPHPEEQQPAQSTGG